MLKEIKAQELQTSQTYPLSTRLEFNVAIDPGSTETRGVLFSSTDDDEFPDERVEPSFYYKGAYNQDYSEIKVTNATVYDCLEVHLKSQTDEKYSFLKGTLAKQFGPSSNASSSISKADQDATQVNIHAFIIMQLLEEIAEKKIDISKDQTAVINLTLALPPEDTDKGRVETIKNELSGFYTAKLPRLNKTLNYTIYKDKIEIVSECNASATYYGVVEDSGDLMEQEENAVVFEAGGRSSSIAIIKEGSLMSKLNMNFNEISGSVLREEVSRVISESKKINRLTEANAERALTEGYYRHGKDNVEVIQEVELAKQLFAKKCVEPIFKALSKAGISASEVQKIIFSGRIWTSEVIKPDETYKVMKSLADYVLTEFNQQGNANAEGIRMRKKYPIPQGLAIYRMGIE